MKFGSCSDVFRRSYPTADEAYARMNELGFSAADVSLADTASPLYADAREMEKWCRTERESAERNGIKIFQVHGRWPTDDTTEQSRAQVWEYMHRAVYGCHLLGAEYLVVHPQMPYGWGKEDDADFSEQLTSDLLRVS